MIPFVFTPHLFASRDLPQNRDFSLEGLFGSTEFLRLRAAFFCHGYTGGSAQENIGHAVITNRNRSRVCVPAGFLSRIPSSRKEIRHGSMTKGYSHILFIYFYQVGRGGSILHTKNTKEKTYTGK